MSHPNHNQRVLLVITTVADDDSAQRLATALVEQHRAACVNILPNITSVYRWQAQVTSDQERLLLIKTTESGYTAVAEFLRAHHPYELPEILAVPVSNGSDDYLNWVRDGVTIKDPAI